MKPKPSTPTPPLDLTARHRRQVLWQITVPLAAVLAGALALAVLAAAGSQTSSIEHWAHISTIFLVIPNMMGSLVTLILLGGLIYLMVRLLKVTPTLMRRVQTFFYLAAIKIHELADKIVQPILLVNGWAQSWRRFWARFKI